jgi:hypothetical protein
VIIAGMATQPGRTRTAKKVVAQLIRDVELLVVHLDGFSTVPKWLQNQKVIARVFPERSTVGAAGKLDCLEFCSAGDTVIVVDDDVRLRRNTIRELLEGLARQDKKTVVGFHGSILSPPLESFVKDRQTIQLAHGLDADKNVDVVATCLTAWHFNDFVPRQGSWAHYNMVDLQFSIDAAREGVALTLLKRPKGFVSFLAQRQRGSIYAKLLKNDTQQTELARQLLGLKGQPPEQG